MKGQARGSSPKLQQGKFWLSIRKNILHCERRGAGAKRSGGSYIPGQAPEQHDPALRTDHEALSRTRDLQVL